MKNITFCNKQNPISKKNQLTVTISIDSGYIQACISALKIFERDPKPLDDILNPPPRLTTLLKSLSMLHDKPFSTAEYELMEALLKYAIATYDKELLIALKSHVAYIYKRPALPAMILVNTVVLNSHHRKLQCFQEYV